MLDHETRHYYLEFHAAASDHFQWYPAAGVGSQWLQHPTSGFTVYSKPGVAPEASGVSSARLTEERRAANYERMKRTINGLT